MTRKSRVERSLTSLRVTPDALAEDAVGEAEVAEAAEVVSVTSLTRWLT